MPTVPQQPPPPQDPPTEEAIIAAVVVLLLSGIAAQQLTPSLTRLLGAPVEAVSGALSLIASEPLDVSGQTTGALGYMRRTEVARRAAYLVSAVRRIATGQSVQAERRHFGQHLAAVRARREAATRVDEAAKRHGPVLGWRTQRDARVEPECARLEGGNFNVTRPPGGQYPGARHGGTCRCLAVAPWPGGKMV